MSALGHQQTLPCELAMSALPAIADSQSRLRNVHSVPIANIIAFPRHTVGNAIARLFVPFSTPFTASANNRRPLVLVV